MIPHLSLSILAPALAYAHNTALFPAPASAALQQYVLHGTRGGGGTGLEDVDILIGSQFRGLTTYANVKYANCFDEENTELQYDIAFLGAPFDTVRFFEFPLILLLRCMQLRLYTHPLLFPSILAVCACFEQCVEACSLQNLSAEFHRLSSP